MNLENWLYRRDREEYILSLSGIDVVRHDIRHRQAELAIEELLRA